MKWVLTALAALAGFGAALAVPAPAEARDGCGRGWYFDGYACRPQQSREPGYGGYGPGYGGPPRGYYEPAPPRRRGGHDQPIYGTNSRGQPEIWYRPVVNRRGELTCLQSGYTVQDGVCKRYRGY